ncbi:MAG: class I SAM-dependent methyltransferase [Candidatus Coatesbacteria bacterium]|nr:class I SAM-dependent methyltransferase [Candidatus Coatesbacteria bacterium]
MAPKTGHSNRPTQAETVRYYDARAAEYDDFFAGRGQFADVRLEIEHDLGLVAPMVRDFGAGRVLDVACGTSFFSACYAEDARSVVGVDLSPLMLSESRTRHRSLRARASLVQAEGLALPFAPYTFDRCFVGFFLSHLDDEDILALLRHLKPVLKATGQLAIVDSAWTEFRKRQGRERTSVQTRRLNGGGEFSVFKRYFTPEELAEILRRGGFSARSVAVGQVFLCAVFQPRPDIS